MIRKPRHLLSAALAAAIIGFASISMAADVADIEIVSDSTAHAISLSLDDLAIGESRQLTASSGQPAIVTRTETGLVVEVAGKRTDVHLPQHHGDATWIDDGHDGKGVKIIKFDRNAEGSAHGDGEHKVIVLKKGGSDGLHEHEMEILTEDLVGPDGEVDHQRVMEFVSKNAAEGDGSATRVTVTRRITSDDATQD